MNRFVAAFVTGVFTASPLLATPVLAQAPHALETVQQAKQVRRGLEIGAQCLLEQKPGAVDSFLAKYPGSKDAARSAVFLSKGDCIDGSSGPQPLEFSAIVLRGALFKALYARDFATQAGTIVSTVPDFRGDVGGSASIDADEYVVTRRFAECVVHTAPDAARGVVLASVETAQERLAFDRMQPTVVGCAGKVKLPEMSRSMLVGVISEVLYRLSRTKVSPNA